MGTAGQDHTIQQGSAIHLKRKELKYIHVNAFQMKQFEHVGGLQNTLMQWKSPLQFQDVGQAILQVINVRYSHWAALPSNWELSIAIWLIVHHHEQGYLWGNAQLVKCKDTAITINVMYVANQVASSDCALFTMGNVTCLALQVDPLALVFDKQQLRPHFVSTLETGHATAFPVVKKHRPTTKVNRVETFLVYWAACGAACAAFHDWPPKLGNVLAQPQSGKGS